MIDFTVGAFVGVLVCDPIFPGGWVFRPGFGVNDGFGVGFHEGHGGVGARGWGPAAVVDECGGCGVGHSA